MRPWALCQAFGAFVNEIGRMVPFLYARHKHRPPVEAVCTNTALAKVADKLR